MFCLFCLSVQSEEFNVKIQCFYFIKRINFSIEGRICFVKDHSRCLRDFFVAHTYIRMIAHVRYLAIVHVLEISLFLDIFKSVLNTIYSITNFFCNPSTGFVTID